MSDSVRNAMRRAYSLGQTYWQQADSEYTSQHRKADETARKFEQLLLDTMTAVNTSDELTRLRSENATLRATLKRAREALGAMLTHMGMDEDEWNKPTFDQARAAISAIDKVQP